MTADPTPPTADLSNEALDALEKDLRRKVTLGTGVVTPLRIQAADTITALRAERDDLRQMLVGVSDERDAAMRARDEALAAHRSAEARAAEAANKRAAIGERSSAMTALAVRDSKIRTKAMREAMAIIAKVERDEMAASDGTPCASAHSDTE